MSTPNQQIAVPPSLLDGFLQYIELSSLATKKACDEVGVHRKAQEKAAALRPQVLAHMVDKGAVPSQHKQAAEVMLGAHDTTMQLLKAAIDKIAEQDELIKRLKGGNTKQAGDLGEGVNAGDVGVAAGGSYEKIGSAGNSLTNPIVGARTSEVKESDKPFLRLAGIHKHS